MRPRIPKSLLSNLKERRRLVKAGTTSRKNAETIWIRCARDPVYFVNLFCFGYDPRNARSNVTPFITYPYQDSAFDALDDSMGKTDVLIEKSRDMGATWICLLFFLHRFIFRKRQTFMLVSRNEDMVDSADPDSMFWKIRFTLDHLPTFLRPAYDSTHLQIINGENGSNIAGTSTTGNIARGGRKAAIMLDEFAALEYGAGIAALAATQAVTKTRIFNSTPQGAIGAFAEMAKSNIRKLRFHWSQHPLKRPGIYTSEGNSLKIIDESYPFPSGYKFITDGKLRSPWYDMECSRCPIPTLIAQELDIDYIGSGHAFFDLALIDSLEAQHAKPPIWTGELDENALMPNEYGRLALWAEPDGNGMLPRDREYVLGVDVSQGTGTSDSAVSIGDRKTGEKVGEFVTDRMRPHDLSQYVVWLAKWLGGETGSLVIFDGTGSTGAQFRESIQELNYWNVWFNRDESKVGRPPTGKMGWITTRDNKQPLLTEYMQAMKDGKFINHSAKSYSEAREYQFQGDGTVDHPAATNTTDPSGAKNNHGDRVIADALCVKGLAYIPDTKEAVAEVPPGSFWGRYLASIEEKKDDGWLN